LLEEDPAAPLNHEQELLSEEWTPLAALVRGEPAQVERLGGGVVVAGHPIYQEAAQGGTRIRESLAQARPLRLKVPMALQSQAVHGRNPVHGVPIEAPLAFRLAAHDDLEAVRIVKDDFILGRTFGHAVDGKAQLLEDGVEL